MKPAASSRGRGIQVSSNFTEIMSHYGENIIVQKYVENSLLLNKRKFHLRIFAIVTSWHPLTIWMMDEAVLLLCAEDHDLHNTTSHYKHISNLIIN